VPLKVQALWWKIEAHCLDEPTVTEPFSARLAREQRWSAEYTQRVIAEYKRFVLLAVTPSRGVTPSEAVDQVWHAHLTYTREYWDTFCGRVLERPLHHAPGNGDAADHLTHLRNYGQTLERYERIFGEAPPADIWPPAELRFGAQAAARVNPRENLIVSWRSLRRGAVVALASGLGVALLLGALAQAHGLAAAALCIGGEGCALFRAEELRGHPHSESAAQGLPIHAYEAIFLARGADAVADAVIANLVARKSLSLVEGRVVRYGLFPDPHPLESAAYAEVERQGAPALLDLQRFASAATRDISARLRGLGLTQSPSMSAPFLLVAAIPVLLLLAALVRHQSVGWALCGCALALLIARARYWNQGVTSLGKAALETFRHDHEPLSDECRQGQIVASGELPAIIALSSLEALRRFELGAVADALTLARLQVAPDSCNTSGGCGCG
jgi:uncharacterized protein (TIGR04222 family)